MAALVRDFLKFVDRRKHYRLVARTFKQTADQLETYSLKAEPVYVIRVRYSGKPDTALLCYLEKRLSARIEWDMKQGMLIARRR